MIQRRIDATDSEIDSLVYDPYGLTNEEIKIVEGRLFIIKKSASPKGGTYYKQPLPSKLNDLIQQPFP